MKPTKRIIAWRDVLAADCAGVMYLEPHETTVLDDAITGAVLLHLRILAGDRAEASYTYNVNL